MKPFLIAASVLASALVLFASGMVAATMLYTAGDKPHSFSGMDTAELWTTNPVKVDPKSQSFERLPAEKVLPEQKTAVNSPAQPASPAKTEIAAAAIPETGNIDGMNTGAISPAAEAATAPQAVLNPDHIAWCSSRYRSYNQEDNSYRPYSGGTSPCVSPYSEASAVTVAGAQPMTEGSYATPQVERLDREPQYYDDEEMMAPEPQIQTVSSRGSQDGYSGWEHEQKCFSLYRTYRPEDNSYQPYDGGPRRQCE